MRLLFAGFPILFGFGPKRLFRNQCVTIGWRGLRGRAKCDSGRVFDATPETLMWHPTTRAQHTRSGLRYGSDLSDAEWRLLGPLLPAEAACGRRRAWPMGGDQPSPGHGRPRAGRA